MPEQSRGYAAHESAYGDDGREIGEGARIGHFSPTLKRRTD